VVQGLSACSTWQRSRAEPPIALQQPDGSFAPASLVHAPQARGFTGILLVPGSGLQRSVFTQLVQVSLLALAV
jgi:hypothetical protein